MTDYQYAWMMYLIGATGCSLAAWLLFRRAGRAWTHFFVITVMVILFTPYAIDPQTMSMAPAIYTLAFGYLDGGFVMIKPVMKLMLGIWIGALILSLIYQLLTRGRTYVEPEQQVYRQSSRANTYESDGHHDHYTPSARRSHNRGGLSLEERLARSEMLHEEPIRAIR